MSDAAFFNYYNANNFFERPPTPKRTATQILSDQIADPTKKDYFFYGEVQRRVAAYMASTAQQHSDALIDALPRHIRLKTNFEQRGHAHPDIEHFGYFKIGFLETHYNGKPVNVVICGANMPLKASFDDGGNLKFTKPPNLRLGDDKAKYPKTYFGYITDKQGNVLKDDFKDGVVFQTLKFGDVVAQCNRICPPRQAPAPTPRQTPAHVAAASMKPEAAPAYVPMGMRP